MVVAVAVSHLRKVFRDLDVGSVGAITHAEIRQLLQRHNLDAGWTGECTFMTRASCMLV